MSSRFSARLLRETRETRVEIALSLDQGPRTQLDTGLPFLDHLLSALALHGGLDLELSCRGDLAVDDHHTVEDCALALGQALASALGDKAGRMRFGSAYAPLDEALARAVIDLSGRPWPAIELGLAQERLGQLSTQNVTHFLESFAIAAGASLHVDVLKGRNDHHRAEAAFKAVALALRGALAWRTEVLTGAGSTAISKTAEIPSTKGVLLGSQS